MNETRRLLVTTDGSPKSRAVLPHAAAFAKAWGAELVLLQVIDLKQDTRAGEDQTATSERIKAELASQIERIGLEATPRVAVLQPQEDVAGVILRVAQESGAGLLAMQSRGHGALRHAIAGSVAMKLIEKSNLPVLVGGDSIDIPPRPDEKYHIVVTSDGSHASGEIVRALRDIVRGASFKVTVMRIYEPAIGDRGEEVEIAEAEKQLRELASTLSGEVEVDIFVRKITPMGGIDTAVMEKATEAHADAIALSTHGYSARRHLLMGSTGAQLLGRSVLPVILAHAD